MLALGLALLVRVVTGSEPASAQASVVEAGLAVAPSTPDPRPSTDLAGVAEAAAEAVTRLPSRQPGAPASGTTRARAAAPGSRAASFAALSGSGVGLSPSLSDVLQDQGVSVPLPDGRSLWIFADTTQLSRAPHFFVTSSAAVSARGSTRLSYAAGTARAPVEFLPRTADEKAGTVNGQRYTAIWPTGATAVPGGRILISYAKYAVTVSPPSYTLLGAGLYAFTYRGLSDFRRGAQATRIADDLWSASDGAIGSPVYSGGQVYFTHCQDLECYSVRSTPSGVTSKASYRWWTGSGWAADRTARTPMRYGASRPGTSPSAVYLPDYGVYATASTAAGHVSGTGQLWVAPTPYGPWSAPASFPLPGCPSAGCYGIHLHPSESTGGRVRVSYATSGTGPYVKVTDLHVSLAANGTSVRLR